MKNTNTNKNTNTYNTTSIAVTPYIYKGIKNITILPEFVELCKMTQEELIVLLPDLLLQSGYTEIVKGDGYIYAKGNIPVLLTAHMDTVHKETVKDFYELEENGNHILSSPQGIGGDDRCGIYIILEIIKTHKCSVLFCEDEEIGGIGSSKFCDTELIHELSELNYMIELDRANYNDAVFYDCDNKEFTNFILDNTGYVEKFGSFSDISYLAPASGIAAVNLSCGYYHAHQLSEEVVIEDMLRTINVVKDLLDVQSKQFKYIKAKYSGYYGSLHSNYYRRLYGYDNWKDDFEYEEEFILCVFVNDYDNIVTSKGYTQDEAWRRFYESNPNVCYNDIVDFYFA